MKDIYECAVPIYRTIGVLDHGYVRLVETMGDDRAIAEAAWVSHGEEHADRGPDRVEKVIAYMMDHGHTSPFEHAHFKFEIKLPIFVMRQYIRHRMQSVNEISARYAELPEEFYIPAGKNIGVQSKDNHQSRDLTAVEKQTALSWQAAMEEQNEEAFKVYRELLHQGMPRELARTVLPVATYTRLYATWDLHNLLHFIRLRTHDGAQYEIRVYAEAMLELIEPIVPAAVAAWRVKYG